MQTVPLFHNKKQFLDRKVKIESKYKLKITNWSKYATSVQHFYAF